MPTTPSSKYRPEIDGLRAFAVVAVIINHFNKDLLPSGYLGVDIFFVISGYVITSSLAGRESKNFLDFLSGFYERRIKRLVPALVVFVLITSVLICLFNSAPETALKTGATSLFGLSNLYLLKQSTDYFAQSTELNPFTHTWSLGVEEQFYLLFPFLIWFSGFGQQTAKGARNLFFWVGALTIASLISFIYLYQVNQPAAYFLMPPRFWEMAAGCLLFIGFQKRAMIEQALEQVPPLLVMVGMVGVMLLPTEAAVPATISVVVLSAILIACLKQGTSAYKFFTLDKVVYIGLISYSLYLWHWAVLCISRWTIGVTLLSAPLQVLLILTLAICSYEIVETRFRRATEAKRITVIVIGGIVVATSTAVVEFIKINSTRLFLSDLYDIQKSDAFALVKGKSFDPTCVVDDQLRLLNSNTFESCTIQPAKANAPTVWAFGDSHAGHLSGMLDAAHNQNGIGYHLIETPGIPFPQTKKKKFIAREVIFNEAVKKMKKGDVILLAQLYVDRKNMRETVDLDRWMKNVGKLSNAMDQKGIQIVIMRPIPIFSSDSVSCSSSYLSKLGSNCHQSKLQYNQIFSVLNKKLEALRRGDPNITLIDPTDALCTGAEKDFCPRNINGKGLYRDSDHLNRQGSAMISDLLIKAISGKDGDQIRSAGSK
jgi:peptidoglycan/LPS O-acetylase OafA/YrhL